jgi:ankyrin repeat protein
MKVTELSLSLFSRINGNMDPLYFTPLMVASMYGRESIVRFLLENHCHYCIVDAQNYFSSYDIDYEYYVERFTKQTALWLAVEYEHLDVAQTLISLGKANVNHKADYDYSYDSNWTPLGVACKNGQLEMVKLLIENGANLYDVDRNNSTCLMTACQYENYEIVKYLLSLNDCDDLLNATNSQGSTALHMLSFSSYPARLNLDKFRSQDQGKDQSISIVNFLFEECKIKIVKDNDGYTPLARAVTGDNEKLTKYFIENAKEPWYTIPQIIDDFELIGSYFLMNSCIYKGYHYLLKAMTLRYNYGKTPLLKTNLLSPNEAYEFCKECQTIKELKSIEKNRNRLLIEGFMIQERLGITSSFLSKLDDYARQYSYWRYVQLSFYAYQLRLKAKINLGKRISNLTNCVDAINKIIDNRRWKPTKFDLFMKILEATENEFIENRNSRSMYKLRENFSKFAWSLNKDPDFEYYYADKCLYIILNLLFIGIKVNDENSKITFLYYSKFLFYFLNSFRSYHTVIKMNKNIDVFFTNKLKNSLV